MEELGEGAIICGSIDMIAPIDSRGLAGRTDGIALNLRGGATKGDPATVPKLTFHSSFLLSRKQQPWGRRQLPGNWRSEYLAFPSVLRSSSSQ